jgi:hypothetical protein
MLHLQRMLNSCQFGPDLLNQLSFPPTRLELGGGMGAVLSDDGIDVLSDSLLEFLPFQQIFSQRLYLALQDAFVLRLHAQTLDFPL